MSCWQFREQARTSYPVELLCRPLGVSAARYYVWRKQQQLPLPKKPAADWQEAMRQAFT